MISHPYIGKNLPEDATANAEVPSTEECSMSNLPPLNDHAFWRNLRVQCNCDKPMSRIAAELGVDVDELCAWIMAYKEPRKDKPLDNAKYGPAISAQGSPSTDAQRFAAWRKQHQGAAETRKANA